MLDLLWQTLALEKKIMDNKIFSVSYSKMAAFRRCLQQYKWKYKDGYYTKSSMGQMRGTAGHSALAMWHKNYIKEEALNAAWNKWSSEGYEDNIEWQLLVSSLERYFIWSLANDTFKLLEAEKEFDITYEIEGQEPFRLNGFIDGIVEEKNKLWILENKFYKNMQKPTDMDTQISLYMLAVRIINYEVQGVIYNMVRVADNKIAVTEPVVRKRIYKSSAGLDKIQDEMIQQVQAMRRYDTEGGTYRNVTADCNWNCSYFQACMSMADDGIEPKQMLEIISNTKIGEKDGEENATSTN